MAYIKNIRIHKTVNRAIEYVCNVTKTKDNNIGAYKDEGTSNAVGYISNGTKTMGGELVSCNFGDWRNADVLWQETRSRYTEKDVLAHHFVESFDPVHGVTPEEAHKIGVELAEKQFGSLGFDYIVATHVDKHHIHNHILVNNVSRRGYEKVVEDEFGNKEIQTVGRGNAYWHNNSTYRELRKLNIDTCRNHGIPAVDARKTDEAYLQLHPEIVNDEMDNPDIRLSKEYTSTSYIKTRAYDTWALEQASKKVKIRQDINEQISVSTSWDDFVSRMEEKGYKVLWKTKDGELRKNVTYVPPFGERGRRDDTLGDMFLKEMIEERIRKSIQKRNSPDAEQRRIRKEFAEWESARGFNTDHNQQSYDAQREAESSVSISIKRRITVSAKKDIPWYINLSKYVRRYDLKRMRSYYAPRNALDEAFNVILYRQYKSLAKERAMREKILQEGIRADTSKMSLSHKKAILEMEETVKQIKNCRDVIHFNNIKSLDDFLPLKMEVLRKQSEVNERIEKGKEDLLEVDKVLDMFESLEKNKSFYDEYNSLPEGEEKDAYFVKYKTHIQNYAYAYRTLNNMNIDLARDDIFKDKQKELQENLNQELREIESLEQQMQSFDMAERNARISLGIGQRTSPVQEVSVEKEQSGDRR